MSANLENSAVGTGLEKASFHPIPKRGNAKEWSNYHTIALISHASKVMFKILQARYQQYVNRELRGVQVQFSSVSQSCLTLCDHTNCSTPGLPVHHQLLEFTQTHVHRVGDAIQPSHPLSSSFSPALNPSLHQSLFQSVNSLHEVAKVLEFQL